MDNKSEQEPTVPFKDIDPEIYQQANGDYEYYVLLLGVKQARLHLEEISGLPVYKRGEDDFETAANALEDLNAGLVTFEYDRGYKVKPPDET